MSKTLVDTNIILRLILRDDELGLRAAEKVVATAEPNDCVVTTLVISEIFYVLRIMGYSRLLSADCVFAVLAHDKFHTDSRNLRLVKFYGEHNLDFVDCYLILCALDDGCELASLDKKAQNVYKRLKSTT